MEDLNITHLREAVKASGNPTSDIVREVVEAVAANNDAVPLDPSLYPLQSYVRSALMSGVDASAFSNDVLGQVSTPAEPRTGSVDDTSPVSEFTKIDSRVDQLLEEGKVQYTDMPSMPFSKDTIIKLVFRKIWERLDELPQLFALAEVEEVSIQHMGGQMAHGTVEPGSSKARYGTSVKIKGFEHRFAITLTHEDIAKYQ